MGSRDEARLYLEKLVVVGLLLQLLAVFGSFRELCGRCHSVVWYGMKGLVWSGRKQVELRC